MKTAPHEQGRSGAGQSGRRVLRVGTVMAAPASHPLAGDETLVVQGFGNLDCG